MASAFESFDKVPIWQRILIFVMGCAVVGGVWFFMFYEEAVERHTSAQRALDKAAVELDRVTLERERYAERQREMQVAEAELQKERERLPTSTAAVDTMLRTFQLQARLVGLTVESWVPEPEQREDFYARLPVKVGVTGSWAQAGEFFRRIYELGRPVSIENLKLAQVSTAKSKSGGAPEGPPTLKLTFDMSTYRFLTQEETSPSEDKKPTRRSRRRRNKK